MNMYNYRAKVVRVVDGDTVDLAVDLGFSVNIHIRARLLDVDTPERGHEDFALATQQLTDLLLEASDNEGYIVIETQKTGKYGRWLVVIGDINNTLAQVWPYE